MYATLAKGIKAVRIAHPQAQPLAAVWLQGESDGKPWQADSYFDNLSVLLSNLRRDCGSATLAFIAVEPAAGYAKVYDAFSSLAAIDALCHVVPAKTLPHMDGLHYNLAAVEIIGQRCALVVAGLLKK